MLDAAAQSITTAVVQATAAQIQASEERTTAAIQALEERTTAAIQASEARSQEFTRDIETKLLAAFHDYANGQVAAIRRIQSSDADLAERISALESRVLRLETRRPPQ